MLSMTGDRLFCAAPDIVPDSVSDGKGAVLLIGGTGAKLGAAANGSGANTSIAAEGDGEPK